MRAVRRLNLELTNMKCILIEISDPTFIFFICCVYRHSNSDILVSFWENVEWSIEKEHELSDKIIILGDFNVHVNSNCYPFEILFCKHNKQGYKNQAVLVHSHLPYHSKQQNTFRCLRILDNRKRTLYQ